MKRVLLDTNFVSDFAKDFPHYLEDYNLYLSLGTTIELTHKGFVKERPLLNEFIKRPNVFMLGNIWPLEEEISNYPFSLNLDDYVLPKPNKIENLFESDKFREYIDKFYETRRQFEHNIHEIKTDLKDKNIPGDGKNSYRHFIKKRLPSKIGKRGVRLRNVPFNCIIRLFPLEKYVIPNKDYKENDFNDILICLLSIYFDIFFTERTNHDILNKLKCSFADIFLNECEIYCNKSRFKQEIKRGILS